jgi:spore maturation protein CgeD
MVKEAKISVILTSYNKANSVGKAIESVLNQTSGNWELFIMDDNSNQETVSVINKYTKDKRIVYYNSHIQDSERFKTTRYATLINTVIPKTTGKYITYLTDDNLFLPNRFQIMVELMERFPSIEIVYSQQLIKWLDENGQVKKEMVRYTKGVLTNASEKVDHCSIMHTRSLLDKVIGEFGSYWDDNPAYWLCGDAAFWNRLTKFASFFPLPKTLDISIKSTDSFQRLYTYLPENIPDGTLIKGPNTDIFIIENQERRKIFPDVFTKLKYEINKVVNIPDPFVFKYTEGPSVEMNQMPNQRLIKAKDHPKVYYIQNNQKYPIKSEKVFHDYKFEFAKIIIVDEEVLTALPEGLPIEEIENTNIIPDGVLFNLNSDFYLSIHNRLHPIDGLVANKLNLPVINPVNVGASFLAKFKKGEPISWHLPFKK